MCSLPAARGCCEDIQNPTRHNPRQQAVADTAVKQGLDDLQPQIVGDSGILWLFISESDTSMNGLQATKMSGAHSHYSSSFLSPFKNMLRNLLFVIFRLFMGFWGASPYVLKHRSWTLQLLKSCALGVYTVHSPISVLSNRRFEKGIIRSCYPCWTFAPPASCNVAVVSVFTWVFMVLNGLFTHAFISQFEPIYLSGFRNIL